jgi:hypothetical protein
MEIRMTELSSICASLWKELQNAQAASQSSTKDLEACVADSATQVGAETAGRVSESVPAFVAQAEVGSGPEVKVMGQRQAQKAETKAASLWNERQNCLAASSGAVLGLEAFSAIVRVSDLEDRGADGATQGSAEMASRVSESGSELAEKVDSPGDVLALVAPLRSLGSGGCSADKGKQALVGSPPKGPAEPKAQMLQPPAQATGTGVLDDSLEQADVLQMWAQTRQQLEEQLRAYMCDEAAIQAAFHEATAVVAAFQENLDRMT